MDIFILPIDLSDSYFVIISTFRTILASLIFWLLRLISPVICNNKNMEFAVKK